MVMPISYKIVSLHRVWDQYVRCFQLRGEQAPGPTTGFGCLTDLGHFAAGCCIFPADRVVLAEFLVTNPEIPMWERHYAVIEMGKAFQTYGHVANKTPIINAHHRGLARALTRAGFKTNGAVCFTGEA